MLSSVSSYQSLINYVRISYAPSFALNTTNLLVRYNMSNSGTTILDGSGNNYNGTASALLLTASTLGSSLV